MAIASPSTMSIFPGTAEVHLEKINLVWWFGFGMRQFFKDKGTLKNVASFKSNPLVNFIKAELYS